MFINWVEECHWTSFGVCAERLPMDHKTDFESTVCVGRGLVRNKGLPENIELAGACRIFLSLRQIKVGTDGDSHGTI
jgi:hypothetical protein